MLFSRCVFDNPLWVEQVEPELATYAVLHWHYSAKLPLGIKKSFGVWENGQYVGAVVFSIPPGRMVPQFFGLKTNEVIELARVALTTHEYSVSKIIAICLRKLKQETDYRLVVSYADPFHGHHGGIYQAGGWIYTGEATQHNAYLGHDGKYYHDRSIKKKGVVEHFGKTAKCLTPDDMKACIKMPRKLRYAKVIGNDVELETRIKAMSKPYPKRINRVGNADSGVQRRGCGSIVLREQEAGGSPVRFSDDPNDRPVIQGEDRHHSLSPVGIIFVPERIVLHAYVIWIKLPEVGVLVTMKQRSGHLARCLHCRPCAGRGDNSSELKPRFVRIHGVTGHGRAAENGLLANIAVARYSSVMRHRASASALAQSSSMASSAGKTPVSPLAWRKQ